MAIKIYDNIQYFRAENITPYKNNARVNDRAVSALVKMIPQAKFNVPIVVDMNLVIVKGHSRYKALLELGWNEIPCIMIDGTDDEIREERLVDNKLSELAVYDDEKLMYEIKEMSFDLRGLGLELPEIRETKIGIRDIEQKDIDRSVDKVHNLVTNSESAKLKEVECEHCHEIFYVDTKELLKYGQ